MREPETEEEKKEKEEKRYVVREDQNYKYNHLHVVEVNDFTAGESRQITTGDFTVVSFDWSPDGSQIVFSHSIDTSINTIYFQDQDISLVPADSGNVEPLIKRPGVDSNPVFSRDGSRIAFSSSGGKAEPIGLDDLYLVSASGGESIALAHTYNRSSGLIDWSLGDASLIISERHHTTVQLYEVSTSETNTIGQITDFQGVIEDVVMNRVGDLIAFTLQSTDSPEDLYVSSLEAFEPVKLTDVHANVSIPEMGRTDLISWTSKDGLEIEGLLTFPVDYSPGEGSAAGT